MVNRPLQTAFQLHQAGNWPQAELLYRQILQADPCCAEALHLLGLLNLQLDRPDLALDFVQQAIDLDPANPVFLSSLGSVYHYLKKYNEAAGCYRRALRLNSNDADDHFNLGINYKHLGRLDEARDNFERALALRPAFAEAHNNAGIIHGLQNRPQMAMACFRRAIQHKPGYAEAYHNLGVVLEKENEPGQAEDYLRQAVAVAPTVATIHYSLGRVLEKQDKFEQSGRSFRQAVKLRPDHVLWRLKVVGLCPAVMPNTDAILSWREAFDAALGQVPPGSINLRDWLADIPQANAYPPFQLPYHGLDDLSLKQKYAQLFTVSPPPEPPQPAGGRTHRIGFLVTAGHEGIFLSLVGGLIDRLRHPSLQPVVICAAGKEQFLAANLRNEHVEFLEIPLHLEQAVTRIRAARFDLIYYWEVGSDALNYFLPFFRLASVQVATWGLSVTTGIPQMDYFISSELLEPPGAQAHYSEKLVKFTTLPTYFYRPRLPQPLKTRGDFGLSDGDHIYLCVQNLLKFHPDFDPLVGQILRRDPHGRLVLLQNRIDRRNTDLLNRLRRTIPDVVQRVQFVPRQEFPDFMNLLALADVILDTPHYSGGNTAHEALATGTPIVTLPGAFLRGRLTLGRYKKMDVPDGVAATPQQYVDIAVRLGTDPAYRAALKAKILAASPRLYEDGAAVQEFEQFCLGAIETSLS